MAIARGRGANAPKDGVDSVAIAHGVVKPLENQRGGALAWDCGALQGARRQYCADIAGKIDSSHKSLVDLTLLKQACGNLESAQTGAFFIGNREAGAADVEFPGDPAGDDAAQSAHGAIGRKRRPSCLAELIGP